jgi:RecA/RadA recombinase
VNRDALVERDAALAVLERSVRMLASGRSSVLEICGHRGTGRTAVLDHAVVLAKRLGATVLTATGECGTVTGGVVAELMSQLPREERGSAAIGHLVALARTTPLLVAVDDGELLDAEARAWLEALAGRAGQAPMAVVVVADAFRPVLHGATTVPLSPLGRGGIAALAARRFGREPDEELVEALHEHTGGRPSVLCPLLDRCDEETLRLGGDAPADVVAAVTRRTVSSLPAEAAELLRVVAVCGPAFPVDLVGVLYRPRTISLGRALELLVCAGLVTDVEKPELAPGVSAARVLEGVPAEARDDLHLRAARLGHQCAVAPSEVARLLVGAPPVNESWVVPLLRAVAREVHPAAATGYLRRALAEPVTPVVRAELVLELAVAECEIAPVAADRRLARMLLEAQPPECADVRLAAADQLWGRGDAGLLRRTLSAVRSAGGDHDSVTALYWIADDAPFEMPELGVLDTAELPTACDNPDRAGIAAWMCASRGVDITQARSLANRALTAPATLLSSRLFACLALAAADDAGEALAGLDSAVEEARGKRLTAVVPQALLMRAKVRAMVGDLDAAAADLEEAVSCYPLRNLHPDARPIVVAADILVSVQRGHLDRAIALRASLTDDWIGFGYARTFFTFACAVLALVTGDPFEAAVRADECGRWMLSRQWVNPAALPWRSIAAVALRVTGEHERAAEVCAEELELARRWGAPSTVARAHLTCAAVIGGEEHLRRAVELLAGSPFRLLRATALLDLAQATGPGDEVKEAGEIAVLCRSAPLIGRARALGWEPGA